MKLNLTRRRLLMGGAAVGALGLGVGVYGATAGPYDFFAGMLRSQLPGVNISDDTIRQFAEDSLLNRNADFAPKLKVLAAGVRVAGFDAVAGAMSGNFSFQKFNREFLTNFLVNSNFFDLADPTTEEVEYFGMGRYCTNPFAQFEPPV